jgi:hypothetical protein
MPTTVTTSGGSTTVTSTGPSYSVKTVVASPSGAKVVVSSSGGATAAAASAPQLSANAAVLSAEELTYAESLVAAGQAHLFAGWPAPGEMDAEKKGLIQQLMESDSLYGGGIPQYVENARVLLAASKSGTNPLEGYSPSLAHVVFWAICAEPLACCNETSRCQQVAAVRSQPWQHARAHRAASRQRARENII